jgi:hypothetical protein
MSPPEDEKSRTYCGIAAAANTWTRVSIALAADHDDDCL